MNGKDLEKELLWEAPHIAKEAPAEREEASAFCEGYKAFLNAGKTERECVKAAVELLEKAGYREFDPKAPTRLETRHTGTTGKKPWPQPPLEPWGWRRASE